MKERLQKILSARGVASRREAERLIAEGRVLVNGRPAVIGESADPCADRICVDGKELPEAGKHVVLMLNKPRGFVTTLKDERGRKTIADLVSGCGCRVYPVGRLDMDSDGLLLLTNDGELANALCHPSGNHAKVYRVQVNGYASDSLDRLRAPMVLDGYEIRPVTVSLLRESGGQAILEFSLREGRNRQIRKMCEQCGLGVVRLTRVRYAGLDLGTLPCGQWRFLSDEEIRGLLGR